MLRRTRPTLIVDIGANRGQFALDVVTTLPDATVISYEPLPMEAAVYRRVFARESRVELRPYALGASGGDVVMHVSGARDSSSLLIPSPMQESVFPGTAKDYELNTTMVRLDADLDPAAIPPRSMLKADVQGYEMEVLKGAVGLLAAFQWLWLELSFVEFYRGQPLAHEIVEFLSARDFVPVDLGSPVRRQGRAVQVDVLFARRHVDV